MVKIHNDFTLNERQTLKSSFFFLALCFDSFNTGKSLWVSHEYVAKSKSFSSRMERTLVIISFFLSWISITCSSKH